MKSDNKTEKEILDYVLNLQSVQRLLNKQKEDLLAFSNSEYAQGVMDINDYNRLSAIYEKYNPVNLQTRTAGIVDFMEQNRGANVSDANMSKGEVQKMVGKDVKINEDDNAKYAKQSIKYDASIKLSKLLQKVNIKEKLKTEKSNDKFRWLLSKKKI